MKYLILLLALMSFTFYTEPKHVGKSGVKVLSAKTQQILGRNVGYYVNFKNNSKKNVDGLKWKAIFSNNFEEVMGEREGKWESGNLITPIEPGEETEDLDMVWVKGSTKVKIIITQVHFE